MAWPVSALALALLAAVLAGFDYKTGLLFRRGDPASGFARKHELWMAEHRRVYADEGERGRRLEIFKKNVRWIEDHNNRIQGDDDCTLRVNGFADLTGDEFTALYMGDKSTPDDDDQVLELKSEALDTLNLPSSVDWRDAGVVAPVKDQKKCGSCWAFAAVATIESAVAIQTGRLCPLSEQQLVDCDKAQSGCRGGRKQRAYKYVINNGGLATEASYPYQAVEGSCMERASAATISSYAKVTPKNESGEIMAAVARQPIAVSIHPPKHWQFYGEGVCSGPCGDGGHAVAVVGYGRDGSTDYWLVKNSWGTDWGDEGYVRVQKGINWCGIADRPYYPIY